MRVNRKNENSSYYIHKYAKYATIYSYAKLVNVVTGYYKKTAYQNMALAHHHAWYQYL